MQEREKREDRLLERGEWRREGCINESPQTVRKRREDREKEVQVRDPPPPPPPLLIE